MRVHYHIALGLSALSAFAGCGADGKSDAQLQAEIVAGMHELVLAQIQGLNQAALDLQEAAPTPIGRGWDGTLDQQAIAAMTEAWGRTRLNWEQAEGILGDLFPDLDNSMDSRYEDLLNGGDPDPFDGQGVVGMHGIERILFSPTTPTDIVAYESTLPGYQPAEWPATDAEATDFKTGICQRLVTDSQSLIDQWTALSIDLCSVFQGITGQMGAQVEKVGLAVDHEEESRYSQTTMSDLRYNLMGTAGTPSEMGTGSIYGLFRPWLATKSFGATLDSAATSAFTGLAATYATVAGDAIPAPPVTFNSDMPSMTDAQSTFGILYFTVQQETDPTRTGSVVDAMNEVAKALGLTQKSCPSD